MLVSFGMMAKSNTLSKAKPFVGKKQNVIVRKSLEEKKIYQSENSFRFF